MKPQIERRPSRFLAICITAACVLLFIFCLTPRKSLADQGSGMAAVTIDLESASQVFDRLFGESLPEPERTRAREMLKNANGFVVLPNILRVGFLISQIQGRGVLIYRDKLGVWQPPLPLKVSGSSQGPHFGLIAMDTLIPLRDSPDISKILEKTVALTGKEVIGPLQASNVSISDTIAYSRARGISVGVAQDTFNISLDQAAISALYGVDVQPHELFSGKLQSCRKPLPVQKLMERAEEFAAGAPIVTVWPAP